MKRKYSKHARYWIKKRRISEEDIEYCITHYEVSCLSKEKHLQYWAPLPGGMRIKVVMDNETQEIITVMFVGEARA